VVSSTRSWYDFGRTSVLKEAAKSAIPVDLETMPLYVREGNRSCLSVSEALLAR